MEGTACRRYSREHWWRGLPVRGTVENVGGGDCLSEVQQRTLVEGTACRRYSREHWWRGLPVGGTVENIGGGDCLSEVQ